MVALLVSPLYEVPQTDDWAYRFAVIRLLETGRFVDLGWGDPTLVLQVLWGGLFAGIFGTGYGVLRVSTLTLVPLTIAAAYFVMRHLGLGRMASGAVAVVFVFQPIALLLAYSFNTDFPYLALATLAAAAIVWADAGASSRRWLGAGAFIGAAFLIRQTGLFMLPVALIALWTSGNRALDEPHDDSRRDRIRKIGALLGPVIGAFLVASVVAPRSVNPANLSNGPASEAFHLWPALGLAVREVFCSVHTLALFALPMLIAGIASASGGIRRAAWPIVWVAALGTGILLLKPWLSAEQFPLVKGWPYQGEYLSRRGMMSSTTGTRVASPAVWAIFTYTLPFASGWLAVRAFRVRRELVSWLRKAPGHDRGARATGIVFFLGVAQFVPFLFAQSFYDRYLVTVVLAVFAVAARPLRGSLSRPRRLALVFLTSLLALLSVEWMRFRVDHAQAIWSVADELTRQGVPAAEIHAGFEWSAHHLFLQALDELDVTLPIDMESGYPWDPLMRPYRYIVTESGEAPPQGDAVTATYRPFLRSRHRFVTGRGTGRSTQ